MRLGFLINGVIELLGGLALLFYPELVFDIDGSSSIFIYKMYGILASIFGLVSLIIWKHYQELKVFRYIFLCIMAFHVFIAFHCYGYYKVGILTDLGATITHMFVFGLMCLIYFRNLKPE